MKIAISASLILLCLLPISYSVGCKISLKVNPDAVTQTNVIYVPTNFSTIQGAINNATPGDKIFVQARTYPENIVINKSISLVGENRDTTIIDGSETGSVINVTANNVNVTGFTVWKSGSRSPSDSGIFIEYSSGVAISNNKIIKNYSGITVLFSSNIVISGNNISENDYNGISILSSSSIMVSDNAISSNIYNGISLYSSSYNVIAGNTISNNYNGIHFTLSSNNTVYHNNCDNKNQVLIDSTNIWNSGDEGNYWSNYTEQDLNGDGIGDLPYIIDENNQDNYPLMGRFSDFNITLKAEYHVTVVCNSTISNFGFEIGTETGNKIIHFNVTGGDSAAGFCRIKIPTALMDYPFIVLVGNEEIIPTLLNVSSVECSYLYFTYMHSGRTISIISSKILVLYTQLFGNYTILQIDLYNLNQTYYELLSNYTILLGNYTLLQEIYRELNISYQQHLLNYSENVRNIQNLMYIFAVTTAVFLITTVYLSKRAHVSTAPKHRLTEEK